MSTLPSQPAAAGSEQSHRVLDAKAKARLQHAVKEFESVMVGYMLKSMRASIPKNEMSGEGLGGDMMEGMFDGQLAQYVSRGSDLGLGEMLYKEITGEEMPKGKNLSSAANKYAGPEVRKAVAPALGPSAGSAVAPAVRVTVAPTAPVPPGVVRPATQDTLPAPASAAPAASSSAGSGTANEGQTPIGANVTAPPDTIRRRLEALDPIIRTAADTTGVNASLLKAVIATESGGRTQARSSRNAKGLMQLIDSTASAMGVRNVWDPLQNVQGGARYLGQMMDRFGGNVEHALASYNAGPGAVEKHNGVPPYKETQNYVGKVLEYLRYFEQQEAGSNEQD